MVLFKQVRIIDKNSPYNGQIRDILVDNKGVILQIDDLISENKAEIIDFKNACISPGWFDIGVQASDPGNEHREDLISIVETALAGGFTDIAIFPNTKPVLHSKTEIEYIRQKTQFASVKIHPIGAISVETGGKDLSELMDMHAAGAVAFSDGKKTIQDSGLLLRALFYVKPFEGRILNHPSDAGLAGHGHMHEGITSTEMGVAGIPAMAEELMVKRDIQLAEYADSPIHIYQISTAGSVQLIREAKKAGIRVTASVASMNLVHTDKDLIGFNEYYKVWPPLRGESDRTALVNGILDGTIDFITSNHVPLDPESKSLEFTYASFGSINLQTHFSLVLSALKDKMDLADIIFTISNAHRQYLGHLNSQIQEGNKISLTLFSTDEKWDFTKNINKSKSENSPYFGQTFKGKALGIFSKGKWNQIK